jgi:HAE1 family hydrophobic/amphiphilic exporter-1
MIFACFVVIGIISGQVLPLEFFPELSVPFMGVDVPYPGSTPEEVERRITQPAEEVLATISGIKRMSSYSHENGCWIEMEFDWGVDADVKALEAREKLDGIRHILPDDLERFYVRKWSTEDIAMLMIRISSSRDLSDSYEMLNRNLKRRIERIPGVSKVDLYGVEQKEIRINLSADRIIAHRIDIGRLVSELERSNFLVTAGKITDGGRRLVVRPVGELRDLDEIKNLVVAGGNVRLKDIAEVVYDSPKLDYGRHLDRNYAIGLDVFKEGGSNTVEVSERVIAEIEAAGDLAEMAGIRIFFLDNLAEGITSSLNELLKSGLLGGLLALVVLFFFMRRIGTTLIVALSVPFSILVTMAFMYFMNISLNILTMMGLMLAVGMLVDNAVVVTESIHRHQVLNPGAGRESIISGVNEVSLAITAGTLTTAIVFLPNIVSPSDQIAVYLKHIAMALVIALGSSLILAQTVVPLLVSKAKPPRKALKKTVIDRLIGRYRRTLDWSLRHRKATVGFIVLLLLSVIIPGSIVKKDMFGDEDERRIRLHYHIDGHYTVEKVEEAVDTFEAYLFENQDEFEIESVYTYYQGDYASSTILLRKDGASKSMKEIKEAIRENLPKLAIANPSFEWRSTGGEGQSIRITLKGKSSAQLAELSREVAWTLEQVDGLTDVRSQAETGDKEVHVVVDRMRAKQYGLSTREVAGVVSAAMRGMNLRPFQGEDGEVPVKLEFQEEDKQTLENLQNLPLFNGDSRPIKLASIADFQVKRGPHSIRREDRTTAIGVTANLDDITMDEARRKIGYVMNNFNLPAGYTWSYGESFDREDEAFKTLMMNLLMALALIYFLMAALFESLVFPAAIWTQIIFAIVGVFWFFLFTGTTFTMMAMIGILILIGVVVNNGIVLIDYVNHLRAKGYERHEAMVEAGAARLRPILMTAGTTVLSLVPLCVVTTTIGGSGGPPYFPMARAIVGGLAFSTIITLLVLPTVYVLIDDFRNWTRRISATAG